MRQRSRTRIPLTSPQRPSFKTTIGDKRFVLSLEFQKLQKLSTFSSEVKMMLGEDNAWLNFGSNGIHLGKAVPFQISTDMTEEI